MPDLMSVPSYADCQGCSLCLLACPMWQQHRDVMFSPQGFAKAMQSGAKPEDIREPLSNCIMCGACDVMCPEQINLTGFIAKTSLKAGLLEHVLKDEDDLTPFMISCDASVQGKINENDLYIIDAAPFHAHYTERVGHYDILRKQTGCEMNLDLNRVAIATGASSSAADLRMFDVAQQVQSLIQGRHFNRVIVENPSDIEVLRETTGKLVCSVADLWIGNVAKEVGMRVENAAG